MKSDPWIDLSLRGVIGFGIALAVLGVLALTAGPGGVVLILMGGMFALMGWAGRRIFGLAEAEMSPDEGAEAAPRPRKQLDMGSIVGLVFGGFGVMMIIMALTMLVSEGDVEAFFGAGIFGLVFCGVGYGAYRVFRTPQGTRRVLVHEATQGIRGPLGTTGQRTTRTYRYVDEGLTDAEIERRQQQWAEAPWTQRDDWAEGVVVHGVAGSLRLFYGFTIAWNVLAWLFTFLAFSDPAPGDTPWFVLIFPLVGVALIVWVWRLRARQRKYGRSVFRLEAVPVAPGARLRGTVETGVAWRDAPLDGYRVRLRCVRRSSYYDRDGDRQVREETLWEQEGRVPGRKAATPQQTAVPIDLALPSGYPETEMAPEDDRTLWRLELTASTPGVDYAAQFEVPVFARSESEASMAAGRDLPGGEAGPA